MKRLILAVGMSVGQAAAASATSTVTILDDSAPDIGRCASLAIGADGLGLAYCDIAHRDLKVAHCANLPCTAATLSTLDTGDVDSVSAIVVGAAA